MKNHAKVGKKRGTPTYRTPSWFKNTAGKQRGFKPPFRRPSV